MRRLFDLVAAVRAKPGLIFDIALLAVAAVTIVTALAGDGLSFFVVTGSIIAFAAVSAARTFTEANLVMRRSADVAEAWSLMTRRTNAGVRFGARQRNTAVAIAALSAVAAVGAFTLLRINAAAWVAGPAVVIPDWVESTGFIIFFGALAAPAFVTHFRMSYEAGRLAGLLDAVGSIAAARIKMDEIAARIEADAGDDAPVVLNTVGVVVHKTVVAIKEAADATAVSIKLSRHVDDADMRATPARALVDEINDMLLDHSAMRSEHIMNQIAAEIERIIASVRTRSALEIKIDLQPAAAA